MTKRVKLKCPCCSSKFLSVPLVPGEKVPLCTRCFDEMYPTIQYVRRLVQSYKRKA